VPPGSRPRDQTLTEKAATTMLPARPSKDDEPRRPDGDFLSTKALLLLIVAGGVAVLYTHSPHVGAAVVAAVTVLAFLSKMVT
jgi:hypothetical protein